MQCQLGLVEFGGRREINTGRLSTWRGVGRCVHHEERGPGLTAATGTTLIVTLTLITPLSEIQKLVDVVSATTGISAPENSSPHLTPCSRVFAVMSAELCCGFYRSLFVYVTRPLKRLSKRWRRYLWYRVDKRTMILKADSYFETFRSDSSSVLDKFSLYISELLYIEINVLEERHMFTLIIDFRIIYLFHYPVF
jgi:hypothetical protein